MKGFLSRAGAVIVMLLLIVPGTTSAPVYAATDESSCAPGLARNLRQLGWSGERNKIAWADVMLYSKGRPWDVLRPLPRFDRRPSHRHPGSWDVQAWPDAVDDSLFNSKVVWRIHAGHVTTAAADPGLAAELGALRRLYVRCHT